MKLLCVLLTALGLSTTAAAQDPLAGVLSHRVLPGWTEADGTRMAGLELTLKPGWKTYWRAPGDAGIPPRFDWSQARNLQDATVHWPAPRIFWQSGMRSIGYENRVVLPLSLTPRRQGRDIRLRGRVDLGVCSDICVPASVEIDAMLPDTAQERSPGIVSALAALPYTEQEGNVTGASCRVTPTQDGLAVEALVTMPAAGRTEDAVIEPATPGIWVSEAKTARSGDVLRISAEMVATGSAPLVVNRSDIRITVIGSRNAVDIRGCAD